MANDISKFDIKKPYIRLFTQTPLGVDVSYHQPSSISQFLDEMHFNAIVKRNLRTSLKQYDVIICDTIFDLFNPKFKPQFL